MVAFLRSIFGEHVLIHPMLKSTAISDAGLTNQTIFEVERQQFTRSTYDRAVEAVTNVNTEIEAQIKKAWGGRFEQEGAVRRDRQSRVSSPEVPAPAVARVRARPILGSPDLIADTAAKPVGAISQSLGEVSERAKRAEEIEKKLTEGQVIVAIDTDLVDPSFVSDRMPVSEQALASLAEKSATTASSTRSWSGPIRRRLAATRSPSATAGCGR